jgi:cytochrome c556
MRLAIPVILAALSAGMVALPGLVSAQDPLSERKAGFDAARKATGEIKAVLDAKGDVSAAADPARRIAAYAARIPSLFPPGSDKGKTDARPEIWTDPSGFAAKAKDLETAATALAAAAAAKDAAATAKQFAAMVGTCKSCHDTFRR